MFDISFLFPKILFTGESSYSSDIKVIKIGKHKKLIVNGMVQSTTGSSSFENSRVWGVLASLVVKYAPNTRNILLLGTGAGTMLKILHKKLLHKKIETTCVEIDGVLIDLAKKYFDFSNLPSNTTIIDDAYNVVVQPGEFNLKSPFDCIIVDTYIGKDYPKNLLGSTFFGSLMKLAHAETLLIFNFVIEKKDKERLKQLMDTLNPYMSSLKSVVIKGPAIADNHLVFGRKL